MLIIDNLSQIPQLVVVSVSLLGTRLLFSWEGLIEPGSLHLGLGSAGSLWGPDIQFQLSNNTLQSREGLEKGSRHGWLIP